VWQWRRPRIVVRQSVRLLAGAIAAAAVLSLGVGASQARPAKGSGQVTITMLVNVNQQPAFDVLISNFERVYPNITVNATYATATVLNQLESTELAAGNAPDLLAATAGCGSPTSVCVLAKAGDLAPMIKAPWTRWSIPLVTSLSKYGQGLFAFELTLGPEGVFTNNELFRRLGVKVPQTFSQLLALCEQAKADGTVALELDGAGPGDFAMLIIDLAVATVYGEDKSWPADLKAGSVTFDGTPGWHQALQEVIDMNNAGCFQPGASGATGASAIAQFAQGQGLMIALSAGIKSQIDAASPQFSESFYPFPGGTAPDQTRTFVNMGTGLGVNAHSSPQNQAAAQTFINFMARPKQDALYAQIKGSLTQYEFLHNQIPAFMSSFASVFANHEYVIAPYQTWWNANVLLTLEQDEVGLLTGQSTVDSVLSAMDTAWRQGPA
jgi:raffinose/stachyose/melibiose transport system substrate-binding protein